MRPKTKIAILWNWIILWARLQQKSKSSISSRISCLLPQGKNLQWLSIRRRIKFRSLPSIRWKFWKIRWNTWMRSLIRSTNRFKRRLKFWLPKWITLKLREKNCLKPSASESSIISLSKLWLHFTVRKVFQILGKNSTKHSSFGPFSRTFWRMPISLERSMSNLWNHHQLQHRTIWAWRVRWKTFWKAGKTKVTSRMLETYSLRKMHKGRTI